MSFLTIRIFLSVAFVATYLSLEVAGDCSAKPIWLSLANCTIEQAETNTTDSWGIELTVEQPGQTLQTLCFVPSALLNNTVLMGVDVCNDSNRGSDTIDQCRSRRGGLFNATVGTGSFSSSAASSLNDPGWKALNNTFDLAGKTTLLLRMDDSVSMPVAVTTGGQNHATSELGLGIEATFLQALVDAGTVPARAFGIDAGSQSVSNPRNGSIVLGGYDEASIGDHFTHFEMNYPIIHSGSNTRVCPLQVNIERLVLRLAGGEEVLLLEEDSSNYACIEPYDNLFRFSQLALDRFRTATGWTGHTIAPSQLYVTEPGLLYPRAVDFNGSLLFTLRGGFEVEIPNYELQHPLRGIAPNGTRVLDTNITEINIYNATAPLHTAVLGKVFLSQVYLAVDYEAKRFSLAKTRAHDANPDPVPFRECNTSAVSGTSIGLIVVGVVLGLLCLTLVLAGLWYWRRIRKRKLATSAGKNSTTSSSDSSNQAGMELAEGNGPHSTARLPGQREVREQLPHNEVNSAASPTTTLDTHNNGNNVHHYAQHTDDIEQVTTLELGSDERRPSEMNGESSRGNPQRVMPTSMSSSSGSACPGHGW